MKSVTFSKIRLWFFGSLALAALGLALSWTFGFLPYSTEQSGAGRHLQEMPDFQLESLEGQRWSSDSLKDQVAVIHFWASWCPPCLDELPKWLELARAYQENSSIQFIALSLDASKADAIKILPNQSLPKGVKSLLDSQQKVSEAFGSFQFPETYLISRTGKIVMKWVGPQDWKSDLIRSEIELVLNGGKVKN